MIDDAPSPRRSAFPHRNKVIYTGLTTGVLLNIVMFSALVAANRVPGLEPHALERNAVSYSLFVLFMLIPVIRFLRYPMQLFASAIIAWVIFAAGYDVAGMIFHDLFDSLRHTPFLALVEGAVVYGVFAVGSWVGGTIFQVRRYPHVRRRHHSENVAPHHQ